MRFLEFKFLAEGFKEAKVEFANVASQEEVKSYLDRFREVVKRNKATGAERNIDYWRKQGWDRFKEFVDRAEQALSGRETKGKKKEVGSSITLKETDKWLIVIPLDKEASCFHGKGTDWCTTKPAAPWFEEYFYKKSVTLIYILKKNTGDKWAIAYHDDVEPMEFFDKNDNSIKAEEFTRQTGLNPGDIVRLIKPEHTEGMEKSRVDWSDLKGRTEFMLDDRVISGKIERNLLKLKYFEYIGEYIGYAGDKASDTFLSSVLRMVSSTLRSERVDQTQVMELLSKAWKNTSVPETFTDRAINLLIQSVYRDDLSDMHREMSIKWIVGGAGNNKARLRLAEKLMDAAVRFNLVSVVGEYLINLLPGDKISEHIEWITDNNIQAIRNIKPASATTEIIDYLTNEEILSDVGGPGKTTIRKWLVKVFDSAKEAAILLNFLEDTVRGQLERNEVSQEDYDNAKEKVDNFLETNGYNKKNGIVDIAKAYNIDPDTDPDELSKSLTEL